MPMLHGQLLLTVFHRILHNHLIIPKLMKSHDNGKNILNQEK